MRSKEHAQKPPDTYDDFVRDFDILYALMEDEEKRATRIGTLIKQASFRLTEQLAGGQKPSEVLMQRLLRLKEAHNRSDEEFDRIKRGLNELSDQLDAAEAKQGA